MLAVLKHTHLSHTLPNRWGFFYVTNHGITEKTLSEFDQSMKDFFCLDKSLKKRIQRTTQNSRGWFNDELTKQTLDWKECLDIGMPGTSKIDGHNQWLPDGILPNCKDNIERYFSACTDLSESIIRGLLAALSIREASAFNAVQDVPKYFEKHTSFIRLNYYPICKKPVGPDWSNGAPDPKSNGYLSINSHSDAGLLTILRQYTNGPSSLQVYHKGEWHRVPPIKNTLTINIGDMMQCLSNNAFVAPVHRVLANNSKERYSAPFFFNPPYSMDVTPIEGKRAPEYFPINWGEFRRKRFEGDFSDNGTEVQISMWKMRSNSRSRL